jgi:hypothetical protein
MKLSEMKEHLAAGGIRLTKSLGQSFLHDGNQLRRIVEAAQLRPCDRVLEIGPGLGPLTELLLPEAGEVLAIEKDRRLVEFIETLPPNLKLRGFRGKYLHKKACEKWLPREIVHRKKKGFANPVDIWFRSHMRSYVDECLLSDHSAVSQYFNRECIQEIVSDHESGGQNYLRQIQLLISFELWHRMFISGSGRGVAAFDLQPASSTATSSPSN